MIQTFQVILAGCRLDVMQDDRDGFVTLVQYKTYLPEYVFYSKVRPLGQCTPRNPAEIQLFREQINELNTKYSRSKNDRHHIKVNVMANTLHPSGHHRMTRTRFKRKFPIETNFVNNGLHGSLRIIVRAEGMLTEGLKSHLTQLLREVFQTVKNIKNS